MILLLALPFACESECGEGYTEAQYLSDAARLECTLVLRCGDEEPWSDSEYVGMSQADCEREYRGVLEDRVARFYQDADECDDVAFDACMAEECIARKQAIIDEGACRDEIGDDCETAYVYGWCSPEYP